jgi:hypothetical protein
MILKNSPRNLHGLFCFSELELTKYKETIIFSILYSPVKLYIFPICSDADLKHCIFMQ